MNTEETIEQEEKVYCADCGCEMTEGVYDDWRNCDGEYVCCACSDDYCKCADCGETIRIDDSRENADGDRICEECGENYFSCEDCGAIIHEDDINVVCGGDHFVCNSCIEDSYEECAYCNTYHPRDQCVYVDGSDWVCSDCRCDGDYFYCDSCGEWYTGNRLGDERDGEIFCASCWEEREESATIHDYSYKPNWRYYKSKNEGKNNFYFGIELEAENKGNYNNERIADEVTDTVPAVCKHDGSINNGFEIVFHPQTYDYAINEGKAAIEDMLARLREVNFAGHNYGGIHVHITRSAFSRLHLYKFHKLFKNCSNLLAIISQRKVENLERWGGFSNMGDAPGVQECRYSALNYGRHTVEVRIFNSTIRTDRFFKNLECVRACLDYSKTYGLRDMEPEAFLRFIMTNHHKYKNLVDFLVERSRGTLEAVNVDAKILSQINKRLSRRQLA